MTEQPRRTQTRRSQTRHPPNTHPNPSNSGQIPEFSDIVDTFLAWHEEILDRHRARRPSNGRIEGTNNLLQVLRRKAHGFTNYANFEARGILITQPDNTEPSSPIPQNREGSRNLCRIAATDGKTAHRMRVGRFPSPVDWL
ncbi:transposase [Candidatus Poriferisodalis sp.]|uniref:transposase n=1 Tax=Candidatus Poriferisodalis sp. TaxID=3101277 RepID=UPI003B59CD90